MFTIEPPTDAIIESVANPSERRKFVWTKFKILKTEPKASTI